MRRWGDARRGEGRSGDGSATRFAKCGTSAALSRAFSAMAAWADWMALDVPVRETPGDWGFRGSGGGARSGSELSHLFAISVRQRVDMTRPPLFGTGVEVWRGKEVGHKIKDDDIHGDQGAAMIHRAGILVFQRPVHVARGIPLDGGHCGGGNDVGRLTDVCLPLGGGGGRVGDRSPVERMECDGLVAGMECENAMLMRCGAVRCGYLGNQDS